MAGNDEAARKARADELRREIARRRGETAGQKPAPTPPPSSPHEFVERRMRELEREKEEVLPDEPPADRHS
jgi:hypothetical protein